MGERFGFYTMVSIFVLFMQAKYWFKLSYLRLYIIWNLYVLMSIFSLFLAGYLADRVFGYGKTISLGLSSCFWVLFAAIPPALKLVSGWC
jgi:POT family proton-dependent oligopeptide transporter